MLVQSFPWRLLQSPLPRRCCFPNAQRSPPAAHENHTASCAADCRGRFAAPSALRAKSTGLGRARRALRRCDKATAADLPRQ